MKRLCILAVAVLIVVAGCAPVTRQDLQEEAISHYQLGQFDDAKFAAQQLVNRYHDDPTGHYILARVYHRQGEAARARFHYRSALSVAPYYDEARLWLDRLNAETGDGQSEAFEFRP